MSLLLLLLRKRRLEDGSQIPQDDRVVHVPEGLLLEPSLGDRPGPLALDLQLEFGFPRYNGLLPPRLGALLLVHDTVVIGAAADAQLAGAIYGGW